MVVVRKSISLLMMDACMEKLEKSQRETGRPKIQHCYFVLLSKQKALCYLKKRHTNKLKGNSKTATPSIQEAIDQCTI